MAQYPKVESIGSIGSIIFAILEVQVTNRNPLFCRFLKLKPCIEEIGTLQNSGFWLVKVRLMPPACCVLECSLSTRRSLPPRTYFRTWPLCLLCKGVGLKIIQTNSRRRHSNRLSDSRFDIDTQPVIPGETVSAIDGRRVISPNNPLEPCIAETPGERINLGSPSKFRAELLNLFSDVISRQADEQKAGREFWPRACLTAAYWSTLTRIAQVPCWLKAP